MSGLVALGAVAVTRLWVRVYTHGLDATVSEARRSEVDSDLWECLHDPDRRDGVAMRAVEIVGRLLRGVPADLAWAFRQMRAADGAEGIAVLARPAVTGLGTGSLALLGLQAYAVWVVQSVAARPPFLASVVVAAAYAAILSLFIAWRLRDRADARYAALTLASLAAWVSLMIVPTGVASLGWRLAFAASVSGTTVAFLRFAAVFPRPIRVADVSALRGGAPRESVWHPIWRAQEVLVQRPHVLWPVGAFMVLLMYVQASFVTSGSDLLAFQSSAPLFWTTLGVFIPLLVAASLLIASLLWTSYRINGAEERRKLLWLVLSMVLATAWLAVAMSFIVAAELSDLVLLERIRDLLFVVFLPVAIGLPLAGLTVAMFYSGALDVRPIISRSASMGLMSVLSVLLFAVVESVLSEVVEARLGLTDTVGAATSGVVTAGVLLPLRARLLREKAPRIP